MKSSVSCFQAISLFRFLPLFLFFLHGAAGLLSSANAQSSGLVWLDSGSLSYAPFAMEGQTEAINIKTPTNTEDDRLEAPRQRSFTLSPNPARELLRLDFSNFLKKEEVYLFSITGALLQRHVKGPGESSLEIPVGDWPGGIYFIRIGQQTQKFIKL